jgi:hypothetical protein
MKNQKSIDLIQGLWEIGVRANFSVVRKTAEVNYDLAREISNSRFDLKPGAVVFPKTAEHVSMCLKYCTKNDLKFRVCSGGHQHEGMSSIEDGVVIRMSEFNTITYPNLEKDLAWIPVGKPLKDVYDELQIHDKTIPGGGCSSVNVGGLALGGGWGTSARKMGLTCDNFDEAEVILANGDIVRARDDNEYKDLFWALRGSGGGNFGIVTKFLFRLHSIGDYISTVNFRWKEMGENETNIIEWYLDNQKDFPRELTSVLSLRVQHKDMQELDVDGVLKSNYSALALVGKYYGEKTELAEYFDKIDFIKNFKPDNPEGSWYKQTPVSNKAIAEHRAIKDFIEGSILSFSDLVNDMVDGFTGVSKMNELVHTYDFQPPTEGITNETYKKLPPPGVTCLTPHPHKISSGYPVEGKYRELAEKMAQKIIESNKESYEGVRLYMVLHGMPGKGGGKTSDESAFYYRDKEILLQFQSWWEKPEFAGRKENSASDKYFSHKFKEERAAYEKDQQSYIDWVSDARKKFAEELEGAFINFVDKGLKIEEYYGKNFQKLREKKLKYDSNDVFSFPMSIPKA